MSARPDVPDAHGTTAALADEIETRWQDHVGRRRHFYAPNPAGPLADGFEAMRGKPKTFVLDMFPYPSGDGLHVGHPLGFIGTDVYARYMRMTGHNVLHTMGFDAFGLPAEQYAVQTGQHPRITTEANVANYRRQLRRLGLGHDPRRSISTTDVTYYRWTQWIFLQIFNSWYDTEADEGPPDRRARGELRVRCARRLPMDATGRSSTPSATRGRRLLPSRLPRRSAGELVPRTWARCWPTKR